MAKPITNDRLYEAINTSRLELKGDISELRQQYNRLEERMSSFEIAQAKKDGSLHENQAILSTKVLTLFAIGNLLLVGLSEAFFLKVFK